jgi:hypothetical protein
MGHVVRLATNSAVILEQICRALDRYGIARFARPEFLWRLVGEADPDSRPPWPEMTAFSDEGLSFINIGGHGFLAVDESSREAVGFLLEELTKDELGFTRRLLAMLLSLTAPALGLTREEAMGFFPDP